MKIAFFVIALILLLAIAFPGGAFLFGSHRTQPFEEWLRVAHLSELPADGSPQMFPVRIKQSNVWSRMPDIGIGCVYLRLIPETGEVKALRTYHSGGNSVQYDIDKKTFRCNCWNVEFDLDGKEQPAPGQIARLTNGIGVVDARVVQSEILFAGCPTSALDLKHKPSERDLDCRFDLG